MYLICILARKITKPRSPVTKQIVHDILTIELKKNFHRYGVENEFRTTGNYLSTYCCFSMHIMTSPIAAVFVEQLNYLIPGSWEYRHSPYCGNSAIYGITKDLDAVAKHRDSITELMKSCGILIYLPRMHILPTVLHQCSSNYYYYKLMINDRHKNARILSLIYKHSISSTAKVAVKVNRKTFLRYLI